MIDAPHCIIWALSGISVSAIGVIFILSIATIKVDDFQFFPPPDKLSWQHKAFIWLFRFYLYPLIALTLILFEPSVNGTGIIRYLLGGALIIIGFGLAFRMTYQMGWRNAFGEKRGLKTDGWFSKSRNPIYVATWIGLAGWAIIANSALVTGLLLLWALMYLAAPHVEEPWLEQQYGDTYREYKKRVSAFGE